MEVERCMHPLRREIQMHAPHAGDPAHLRVHNSLHERGRHGGIHDIPSLAQDVRAGFGRFGLRG
jgi:hypothetical protein